MKRLCLPLLLLSACNTGEPAPEELDALVHWFWVEAEAGEDASLADGLVNLHAAVDGDALDGPERAEITRLTEEEVALVRLDEEVDPSLANGMLLVNTLPDCTVERLRDILTAADQDQKYPGSYDVYERTYASSQDDWDAGTAPTLTWQVDYETSNFLTGPYSSTLLGWIRGVDPDGAPFLLQRTHLPFPSRFEDDSKSFTQYYQLELYWERDDGQVLHVLGIWRQMDLGEGLTTEDDIVIATTLSSMEDWDEQTNTLCAEAR